MNLKELGSGLRPCLAMRTAPPPLLAMFLRELHKTLLLKQFVWCFGSSGVQGTRHHFKSRSRLEGNGEFRVGPLRPDN